MYFSRYHRFMYYSTPLHSTYRAGHYATAPRPTVSHTHTHTHTQPFYSSLDFVHNNLGEPVAEESFTHSHSSWSSIIPFCFLRLLRAMPSLFNPHALQSFSTISLQVFFGLPLGLAFQRAEMIMVRWMCGVKL